jgi:recombination protein RecT
MSRDLSTIQGFTDALNNYKKTITSFLHQRYGISVEEFVMTCVRAVKENPKLLQCEPKSLFGAILLSAECGLRPNTSDQHAFILPFKGQAKFQIGYKGLIELMYRNPRVKTIFAEAVYEKDFFDYGYGLNPYLEHKPFRNGDRGKLTCVYAVCKLHDGEPIFSVVEKNELDKIRNFSQTIDSTYSPYNNGTDIHNWMEIKASVKKLSKIIPKSSYAEISKAVEYDSKFEGGAKVLVDIPSDPNEIVEPKIIDGNLSVKNSNLESSFDDFDVISSSSLDNPTEHKPMEEKPMEQKPMEQKPMEEKPMEEKKIMYTSEKIAFSNNKQNISENDNETNTFKVADSEIVYDFDLFSKKDS